MKIGMLSSDWGDYQISSPGGCTWIRMFGPAAELNNLGIETLLLGKYHIRHLELGMVIQ